MKLIKRQYEKEYYDNPIYRESENSQRNQSRLTVLREHQPSGRLLEIGFGQGGFLRLAEAFFDVEGMDVSSDAVNAIRPYFGSRVSVVNVEQRPLPRCRYDAIAVFNILEHLRRPHKVIDKLSAALNPGGVLIGSVPNNQSLVGSVATLLTNFFDRTHVSTFKPEVWRRLFEHAGFRQIILFGEVTIGRNHCKYLRGSIWRHLSFNLMFICKKQA